MPGSKGKNTMQETLQGFLADLAFAKTLPDADLEFLVQLETTLLQKLRSPVEQMSQQMDSGLQGVTPSDNQMPGGMGGGMPGGPPVPSMPVPPTGGGVPGMRSSPGMPNPDELRRLLTKTSGA